MKDVTSTPRLRTPLLLLGILLWVHPAMGQFVDRPTAEERASQFSALETKVQQAGLVRVIVLMDVSSNRAAPLANTLADVNRGTMQTYSHFPLAALEVDPSGLNQLSQNDDILGIEENIPHAPYLSESTVLIGAEDAWSLGYTGEGQTVAILDTGSYLQHDFIKNKIVAEACFSTTVSGVSTSLCPNGSNSQTGSGSSAACNANSLGSACNHGTGVAGVAAGEDNGSIGFDGVAPDADIISINVFSNHNGSVLTWSSDYIAGLDYVYSLRNTYDIAAANLSLGGGQYSSSCDSARPSTKTAADQLKAAGIAVIAATGNDGYTGSIGAPACISSIISVGSTTKLDAISSFSNHANIVDLMAPGSSITTAWASNDGFSAVNGTSFATPTVTGVWALMREADSTSTVDQLLQILQDTGEDITGRSGVSAIPRVQVDSAIASLGCNYSWRIDLTVKDKTRSQTTLNLGQGSATTDGLDTNCGESKRPPAPPSTAFGAVFDLPGDSLYSRADYRSTSADTAQWELTLSGVHPFTLTWDPSRLPTGFFRLRDNLDGSIVNVDMKAVNSYRLSKRNVTGLVITRSEAGSCTSVSYPRGWSLISLPLDPLDPRKTAIFKSSKLAMYGFDGAYTVPTSLAAGEGYWIFHKKPKTYTLCGYDAGTTVSVSTGWNLIAGHDVNVDVDAVTTTPSNLVQTDFFGFEDGYVVTDSLKKAEAYWVRVSGDGVMNVLSGGSKQAYAEPRSRGIATSLEERIADSTWAVLRFTDAKNARQTLFLNSDFLIPDDREAYLLPPRAPGTPFDARFVDNLQVSDQQTGVDTLMMSGFTPPITIEVSNLPYQQVVIQALNNDRFVHAYEGVRGVLPTDASIWTVQVKSLAVSNESSLEIPKESTLYQNFPNPASTQSAIRFGIPQASKIQLKLYNMLGQQVAFILDQFMEPGYHMVSLDTAPFPSGTYIYVLETPTGRIARRLTIVH